MTEVYGDAWDCTEEVREMCLNCKYPDCFGSDGCPERRALIAKLKAKESRAAKEEGVFSTRKKTYEMDGERRTLGEWCRLYGISYAVAWQRMQKGMDIERAVKDKVTRGGARKHGQMIKIMGEEKGITEWLELYHVGWKTVNRYTKEHKCSRAEAVKALCERKMR